MASDPLHSYRLDRRLAAILGGSIALHLGIAIWAWTGDVDLGVPDAPQGHLAFRQETEELTLPELVPQPGAAIPEATTPSPVPVHAPAHPSTHPAPTRLDTRAEAMRLAALVGDQLGHEESRAPGLHLADPLTVEIGHHDGGTRTGPALRIGPSGPTLVEVQGPEVTAPKQDIRPLRVEPAPGAPPVRTTLTPGDVTSRITAAYLPGLQRCYQRALSTDATLTGRVAIAFAVDATGHATDGDVTGASGELGDCIEKQMTGWRFGIPRDTKGEPTEATFRVVLALRSS